MSSLKHSTIPKPAAPPMRGFAIAGAGVIGGLLGIMLWPAEPVITTKTSQAREVQKVAVVQPVQIMRSRGGSTQELLESKLDLQAPAIPEINPPDLKELSLTARLDDFFLTNVSLKNVPLGQAMARLKQMLLEADTEKALALHKLIVTIPTNALGRLVTLESISISYLEAVRTLAMLAGCDAEVGEHQITLKTQRGPWPQVAEKRSITDMLMFEFSDFLKNNSSALVAEAKESARRLGLKFDDDNTANLTSSQWGALQRMMAYRDRLASRIPPFAAYLLPDGYLPPILQVTPQQVVQLMMTLNQQGFAAYSDVPYGLLDPTMAQQIVIIVRVGERVMISQHTTIPTAEEPRYEEVAVTQPPGDGPTAGSTADQGSASMTMLYVELRQEGSVSRIGEGEESRLVETNAASMMMAAELLRTMAANPDPRLGYSMGSITGAGSGETAPANPEATPVTTPAAP